MSLLISVPENAGIYLITPPSWAPDADSQYLRAAEVLAQPIADQPVPGNNIAPRQLGRVEEPQN
jgi:hypothetical protein